MKTRTEIINNRIVNTVEQLASFLKPGDIFRKRLGRTQYKVDQLRVSDQTLVCENLETHTSEEIYYKSPVLKLMFL